METGKMIKIKIISQGTKAEYKSIIPERKKEKTFLIATIGNPDPLQKQILESWLKG
jgi:c-di-GMP-binding flagellar brake protein YcgR